MLLGFINKLETIYGELCLHNMLGYVGGLNGRRCRSDFTFPTPRRLTCNWFFFFIWYPLLNIFLISEVSNFAIINIDLLPIKLDLDTCETLIVYSLVIFSFLAISITVPLQFSFFVFGTPPYFQYQHRRLYTYSFSFCFISKILFINLVFYVLIFTIFWSASF